VFGANHQAAAGDFMVIIGARPDQSEQGRQSHCRAEAACLRQPANPMARISNAVSRGATMRVVMIALSVIDARRIAVALGRPCGEIAIAYAVLQAQEAKSRSRYEKKAEHGLVIGR
jgi:hypothetical protein